MSVPRTLAAALCLVCGLGLSCYSEQLPPPAFRYACDGDADCSADELCRRGLCVQPCTQVTAADDCPGGICFNGTCASTCSVGSDFCPQGQACVDLGLNLGGDGGSPFGGGSTDPVGLCGFECDGPDNADVCPQGEVCFAELSSCVVDCSAGQTCPETYSCLLGFCIPAGVEIPGFETTTALPPGDGSSGDATSTGDGTGDATATGSGTDGDGSSGGALPGAQEDR